jgi:hypothetical protein
VLPSGSEDVVVVPEAEGPPAELVVAVGVEEVESVGTPSVAVVVVVVEVVAVSVGVVTETGPIVGCCVVVVLVVEVVVVAVVDVVVGDGAIVVELVLLVIVALELPAVIVVSELVVVVVVVVVCAGSCVSDCSVRSRCATFGAQSEPDVGAGAAVLGSDDGAAGVVSVGVVSVGVVVGGAGVVLVGAGVVVVALVSVDVMSFTGSAPTVSCTVPASAAGVGGVPGSGTLTGEPTESSTTAAFVSASATSATTADAANGRDADVLVAFGGRSEYVFETARTRTR